MTKEQIKAFVNSEGFALEDIIENSYDSIFVTNSEGTVLLANPAAEKLLNIPLDELIGSNVNDLVAKGYYDRSTAMEAVHQKRVVNGTIKTLNGTILMCSSKPLFDENGNVKLVISNSRDKNALKEFTETLEKERAATKRYKNEVKYLRDQELEKHQRIIAASELMRNLLLEANTIAPTDSSVLLCGESGTGKEVIAKYLHKRSRRADEAFVTVNCAAIPESLLEAELFGYEKGSFTGADAKGKSGLFEIADKGTLFLDEIGEMPLSIQPKLLRALETSEIRRVGGTTSHKVDVRVICATNRNLKKMVEDKLFREDLYYRINVIPLIIPPLRKRPDDILALTEMFLQAYNKKYNCNKTMSKTTIEAFLRYDWPGNVRELKNVIERLVITTRGNCIDYPGIGYRGEMQASLRQNLGNEDNSINYNLSVPAKGTLRDVMGMVEKQYIQHVLEDCKGCVSEAARRLGIHRSAIYRKIEIAKRDW